MTKLNTKKTPEEIDKLQYDVARSDFYMDTVLYHLDQNLKNKSKMSNDNDEYTEKIGAIRNLKKFRVLYKT